MTYGDFDPDIDPDIDPDWCDDSGHYRDRGGYHYYGGDASGMKSDFELQRDCAVERHRPSTYLPATRGTQEETMTETAPVLRAEVQRLLIELANAQALEDRFPAEPPHGSVLRWVETFGRGSQEYAYVALRVGDNWHVTGRNGGAVTSWSELRDRIGAKPSHVATTWHEIPQPRRSAADEATDPQQWWELVYGKGANTVDGSTAGGGGGENGIDGA
jgi:hypothetical protein